MSGRSSTRATLAAVAILCVLAAAVFYAGAHAPAPGQEPLSFVPAKRIAGSIPLLPPPNTVGWVEEAIELRVEADGRVRSFTKLTSTPGAHLLEAAVGDWTFRPARAGGRPVASRVLVMSVFRPPVLVNAPTVGSPPVALATPSAAVPMPAATVRPPYPPNVVADGVAIVELLVGADGALRSAALAKRAAGFDDAALGAVEGWTFRPARRDGTPVPAYAYVVFGFRRPVL